MRYTEEELIESLQKFYKENNRAPKQKECSEFEYLKGASTYINRFGTWDKVCSVAGIPYSVSKFNTSVSKEYIIEGLTKFFKQHGRPPKVRECKEVEYLPSDVKIRKEFGSWDNALKEAGLSTSWTIEKIKKGVLSLADELGRTPTSEEVNKSLKTPSRQTIYKKFGGYDNLLGTLNLKRHCNQSHITEENLALSYNKEWLLEQNKTKPLQKISEELGFNKHKMSDRFKELGLKASNSLKVSQEELDLLAEIKILYSGEILTSQRLLEGKEIDIYLPELKLGIEFNGLYWHSEKQGKGRNYHLNKTLAAEKLGIRLVHIFEHEWVNQRELVLSRIKNMLGKSYRIYARKCTVSELGVPESKEFLNTNHIQKYVGASVKLGLYYEEDLVAVMTFGKSRYSGAADWELIRYANRMGSSVVGGASKLFKYFLRNYKPKGILSYSDRRWNTGNLYSMLGFTHTHNSSPNYWYFKGLKVYSRVKFQKHKLANVLEEFEPKWTEVENMYYANFNRFFDSGNSVFLWNP